MNLLISFSGREGGNCDQILDYISTPEDVKKYFRIMNIHSCSHCQYECFSQDCKYHDDDIYALFESMLDYEKVILVVPMYCGNPSSLYFIFNERCQDFFMRNEEKYGDIISRLYIIGIYGNRNQTPDFIPCFEKWFTGSGKENHILGIERHIIGQGRDEYILSNEDVKQNITQFLRGKSSN
jgi:multimeric flavodoxin WrbA